MPSTNFLAISLGANHICSVHLKMNPSGRCELVDYQVDQVELSSSDPFLWLKATSSHLDAVALRFRGQHPAGFSIPGHVALCKYLKVAQVSASKRSKIVAFEAKQNIPYPIEEVTWEHSVIEEDDLDFDVVIGASRTEIVESIARYSKDAEIELRGIEPSATTLANAFRYNYGDEAKNALILSIGAKSTDLVFVDRSRFHSRNIPFGGQSVTNEMAELLGISVSEAERVKLVSGEEEILSEGEMAAYKRSANNFQARLASEILRTNTVLKRQGFNFDVDKVYLTGGGSLLSKLDEKLAEKLRLEVARLDPLKNISVSDESLQTDLQGDLAFLADAIGMGVGRFMPDGASLDLTPRSIVWQRKFRRQQPFYILAGLVACGAVALPILNTTLKINAYEQELQNLNVQIQPLRKLNQEIHSQTEQIRKIRSVMDDAAVVAEARPAWQTILNDMQSRLAEVEDVWLDNLRLDRPDQAAPSGRGVARVRDRDTRTKIQLVGRLMDADNPVSNVSPDSYERVKTLLESFREADFVAALENERFDYSVPGILRFDFTLIVKEDVPL
ncbi:pilus assembly protein PilM [Pelagicoccus albus]|uniref:Pilus assembly protein PilM n=1 Tax=Pelagicoccus albus TaxID=415222 RepID=A0A7X1B478_9BACT|nr:pilus assembly protein PilM [Pelagicoccus albus]MBC2605252.1 pilus assembly protein PilM [Pelagicoccus albus]